jgi:hypothetical protein
MGFLSKLNKSLGFSKGTKERARALKRREASVLTGLRNTNRRNIGSGLIFGRKPRGNMGSDFRLPQKNIAFSEAIRRLQEQRDMGMPRRPSMPGMGSPGGTPGFYDRVFKTVNPRRPSMGMIGTPQPIPERMPTDPSSYYNPTIFGQQMGDMDFSQMPEISPVDMSNLQMPTLPREISQMDLPQMPEGLPSMQDVQGMPQMRMGDMQPRMMMQAGDEVSPEQEIFSLQAQLKNLEEQLRMDRSYNDDQAVINTSAEMAAIQKRMQEILSDRNVREIMGERGRTISDMDSQMGFKAAGSIGSDDQGNPVFPEYAGGDEVSFPDLTGDGKVTQADILKGRGVYAEGDEVMMMQETDMMAPGNQEIEASLMEVQGMQPDMQVLDQYVQMVTQMIQAGASEAEVIESLRQAGLDDDDIAAVFQAVMETMQGSMEQGGIDAELAQLG